MAPSDEIYNCSDGPADACNANDQHDFLESWSAEDPAIQEQDRYFHHCDCDRVGDQRGFGGLRFFVRKVLAE